MTVGVEAENVLTEKKVAKICDKKVKGAEEG